MNYKLAGVIWNDKGRIRVVMKCYISNYENDIREITDFLNKKGIYPENAYITADLYHEFCSQEYCASWLALHTEYLEHFVQWIKERYEERDERIEHLCD